MPYKVTLHGLSLEEAQSLARQHLNKPEIEQYGPLKHEQMFASGKVALETFLFRKRLPDNHEIRFVPLAEIEYEKGGDDALPSLDS